MKVGADVPTMESINSAAPPTLKKRIEALDVIRGLSILGILAVNADGFAAPMAASLNPSTWVFPNHAATALSYWMMDTFFHEKFVTLFSMLFGVSLFLVGGERTDKQRERILWRRLGVLFLFAMLHGFGIWWGDILSVYAVTGVLMAFCRSWRPRTLMIVGVLLYTGMASRQLPLAALPFQPNAPTVLQQPNLKALAQRRATVAADLAEAKRNWTGAYRVNTREYLHLLSRDPWLIPSTLGLMMIGLSLFKSGFLAESSTNRRYTFVSVAGMLALITVADLCWQRDVQQVMTSYTNGLLILLAPPVSLAYAAVLILLLRSASAPHAETGRGSWTYGIHKLPHAVVDHDFHLLRRPGRFDGQSGPSSPVAPRDPDLGAPAHMVAVMAYTFCDGPP